MNEHRFKGIEIKVGAVVILAGIIFLLSLIYIGYRKDLFAPKLIYWLKADSGQDLSRGLPVKFSGFQIGSVKDLYLEEDGSMKLKIAILKKYSKWVREDSQFFLAKEAMIGPPVIVLKTGKAGPASEGTVFKLQREKGIEALAEEVKPVLREVTATISEIHKLLASINDPQGKYQKTLANVEKATRALNEGDAVAKYILHDQDSTQRLKTVFNKIALLIDNLNMAAQQITETTKTIEKTVMHIDDITLQLKMTVKAINEQLVPALEALRKTTEGLPEIRRKVDYTLELSKDLVIKLHNTWPLNKQERIQKRPFLPQP